MQEATQYIRSLDLAKVFRIGEGEHIVFVDGSRTVSCTPNVCYSVSKVCHDSFLFGCCKHICAYTAINKLDVDIKSLSLNTKRLLLGDGTTVNFECYQLIENMFAVKSHVDSRYYFVDASKCRCTTHSYNCVHVYCVKKIHNISRQPLAADLLYTKASLARNVYSKYDSKIIPAMIAPDKYSTHAIVNADVLSFIDYAKKNDLWDLNGFSNLCSICNHLFTTFKNVPIFLYVKSDFEGIFLKHCFNCANTVIMRKEKEVSKFYGLFGFFEFDDKGVPRGIYSSVLLNHLLASFVHTYTNFNRMAMLRETSRLILNPDSELFLTRHRINRVMSAYIELGFFNRDNSSEYICKCCEPNPITIIGDGISLGVKRNRVPIDYKPPTFTDEHSPKVEREPPSTDDCYLFPSAIRKVLKGIENEEILLEDAIESIKRLRHFPPFLISALRKLTVRKVLFELAHQHILLVFPQNWQDNTDPNHLSMNPTITIKLENLKKSLEGEQFYEYCVIKVGDL